MSFAKSLDNRFAMCYDEGSYKHRRKEQNMDKLTTQAAMNNIRALVKQCIESGEWGKVLKVMSQFHSYSFNNMLMIYMQRPDATRVAGYRTWQKMGRQVQKGEKGIRIFAPCPFKKKDADGEEIGTGMWFKIVSVFDISQTEGDDLPEALSGRAGDHGQEFYDSLASLAKAEGYTIKKDQLQGAKGVATRKEILLEERNSMVEDATTIAHELAHHKLGHLTDRKGIDRDRAEFEAESVAYLVAQSAGIESEASSGTYLLSWAQGDADKVMDVMMDSGKIVAKVANDLITALVPMEVTA